MTSILFYPPVLFVIILCIIGCASAFLARYAFPIKRKSDDAQGKAYACGEEFDDHMARPDYSQFFPFAFFFTLLHVAVLVIAAIPKEAGLSVFAMALVYFISAAAGLRVLLRKMRF